MAFRSRLIVLAAIAAVSACSEDTLHSQSDFTQIVSGPGTPGGDGDAVGGDPAPPGDGPDLPATCQIGGVMGRLCLPNAEAPLAGAHLTVTTKDCAGDTVVVTAESESNGHFALPGLPAGVQTVEVDSPTWSGEFQVTVVPGEILFVGVNNDGAPLCTDPGEPRLAVIKGEYDQVQRVLDGLGLHYDLYESAGNPSPATQFLSNLDQMLGYDVIFFNCGRNERDFMHSAITYSNPADPLTRRVGFDYEADTYQNLRDFVVHGGNVYASDWSWPIAESLNPTVIDFHGDETNATQVNIGAEREIIADITDDQLQLFMASPDLTIDFNLQGYAIIDDTSDAGRVYVRGDVPVFVQGSAGTTMLDDRPLLVGFRPFADGGVVLYTTFHYHAQTSGPMMTLLRYLIFQL